MSCSSCISLGVGVTSFKHIVNGKFVNTKGFSKRFKVLNNN